jgi:hypothetical protein
MAGGECFFFRQPPDFKPAPHAGFLVSRQTVGQSSAEFLSENPRASQSGAKATAVQTLRE